MVKLRVEHGLAACLAVAAFTGMGAPSARAQCSDGFGNGLTCIWDTGTPQLVTFNGAASALGWSSGYLGAAQPQRWVAAPFTITQPNTVITEIHVNYFVNSASQYARYIIWRRNGNTGRLDPVLATAPSCLSGNAICDTGASMGAHLERPEVGDNLVPIPTSGNPNLGTLQPGYLGPANPDMGVTDPRGGDGGLHIFNALTGMQSIALQPGDYYFSFYGDTPVVANTSANLPWFTGADLTAPQFDPALLRNANWRAACFPEGAGNCGDGLPSGFRDNNPTNVSDYNYGANPPPDSRRIWMPAFQLLGQTNFTDCNNNGTNDSTEPGYSSADCDGNGILDFCEWSNNPTLDCDHNHILDSCEFTDTIQIVNGQPVCNQGGDGINDRCQPGWHDCNTNNNADCNDLQNGASDCNGNGTPDECDIASGSPDCNTNGMPDACDIAQGAADCDANGIMDICETADFANDCNTNGTLDRCDILGGEVDCNNNNIPDLCESNAITGRFRDCNTDGIPDNCQTIIDCNTNTVHDPCETNSTINFDAPGPGGPFDYLFPGAPVLTQLERRNNLINLLNSDKTEMTPPVAGQPNGLTAGDFQNSTPITFTHIYFEGGYSAAGLGGNASDDRFTIKIWPHNPSTGLPGTPPAGFSLELFLQNVGATPGQLFRRDTGGGTGQLYQYVVTLASPVTLPAGRHWMEIVYTSTVNTNDWFVGASLGYGTAIHPPPNLVLSVNAGDPDAGQTELWGYTWILGNTPPAAGQVAHIIMGLFRVTPDTNGNSIPDVCESFPGTCPDACRGDLNGDGLVDGTDVDSFVCLLLMQASSPCGNHGLGNGRSGCADLNHDNGISALDVPPFVSGLLAGSCTP